MTLICEVGRQKEKLVFISYLLERTFVETGANAATDAMVAKTTSALIIFDIYM